MIDNLQGNGVKGGIEDIELTRSTIVVIDKFQDK